MGRAAVPSGASTGTREPPLEIRDNDKKRFHGKGVQTVVENVDKIIAPEIIGLDALDQRQIDRLLIALDGTKNKSKIGAKMRFWEYPSQRAKAAATTYIPLFKYIGGSNSL